MQKRILSDSVKVVDPIYGLEVLMNDAEKMVWDSESMVKAKCISVAGTFEARVRRCLNNDMNRGLHALRVLGMAKRLFPRDFNFLMGAFTHDIGHGAYSHQSEMGKKDRGIGKLHEERWKDVMLENGLVAPLETVYGYNILKVEQFATGQVKSPLKGKKGGVGFAGVDIGFDHLETQLSDIYANHSVSRDPGCFRVEDKGKKIDVLKFMQSIEVGSKYEGKVKKPGEVEVEDAVLVLNVKDAINLVKCQLKQDKVIFSDQGIAIHNFSKIFFGHLLEHGVITEDDTNKDEIYLLKKLQDLSVQGNDLLKEAMQFLFVNLQGNLPGLYVVSREEIKGIGKRGVFEKNRTYEYLPKVRVSDEFVEFQDLNAEMIKKERAKEVQKVLLGIKKLVESRGKYYVLYNPPEEMKALRNFMKDEGVLMG